MNIAAEQAALGDPRDRNHRLSDEVFFDSGRPALSVTSMYGMRPLGDGTPFIESLYSYCLRQADAQLISVNRFFDVELAKVASEAELTRIPPWRGDPRHLRDLVSNRTMARDAVPVLQAATGRTDLAQTTLIGLGRSVDSRGITLGTRRVCRQCISLDFRKDNKPYGRLLWTISAVDACPIHKVRLVEAGCRIGVQQNIGSFLRRPLFGVCSDCGSIGYQCTGSMQDEPSTAVDIWRAEACGAVLMAQQAIQSTDPEHVKKLILEYSKSADGGLVGIAARAGVSKTHFSSNWIRKPNAQLSLAVFLDICATERIELAHLLSGKFVISRAREPMPPSRPRRTFRRTNREELAEGLKVAVANGESIVAAANRLNVDRGLIKRFAPEIYTRLIESQRQEREFRNEKERVSAVGEAESVFVRLREAGRTPTSSNASLLTGTLWRQGQVRAMALKQIRIQLGAPHIRSSARYSRLPNGTKALVDAAVARLASRK